MIDNKILEITHDVKWIGVLDPDLRKFDVVMETLFGTTYNSYFINAEKKTIIETTKARFFDVYLDKIKELTDPAEIKYIVVNHTEPDHSGNVIHLLHHAPNAIVVGSGNAIKYLKSMNGEDFPYLIVKDGEEIDLGNKKLRVISAPNLHWPDSMYTYLVEDKLLFTCDSFGAHYCHHDMYDDMVGDYEEAFKYYFDVILKPYSKFLLKAIEKIRPLDIQAICTGHGPILRTHWKKMVELSEKMASEACSLPIKNKVFIPYVSAYHNTGLMAEKLAEGIHRAGDFIVDVCDIESMSLNEVEKRIAESNAYIIGSPTINQNILLQTYQIFALINPIRDREKLAAAFGSFGWSGEGEKLIESNLANLKLKLFGKNIFIRFSPHKEILKQCIEFGEAFGKRMNELIKEKNPDE